MRADYRELLNLIEIKFNIPRTSITLCTIPPLANLTFRIDFEKSTTLHLFNNWLRNIWREYSDFDMNGYYLNYNLADFDETFRNDAGGINYNYYQKYAKYLIFHFILLNILNTFSLFSFDFLILSIKN